MEIFYRTWTSPTTQQASQPRAIVKLKLNTKYFHLDMSPNSFNPFNPHAHKVTLHFYLVDESNSQQSLPIRADSRISHPPRPNCTLQHGPHHHRAPTRVRVRVRPRSIPTAAHSSDDSLRSVATTLRIGRRIGTEKSGPLPLHIQHKLQAKMARPRNSRDIQR